MSVFTIQFSVYFFLYFLDFLVNKIFLVISYFVFQCLMVIHTVFLFICPHLFNRFSIGHL